MSVCKVSIKKKFLFCGLYNFKEEIWNISRVKSDFKIYRSFDLKILAIDLALAMIFKNK